MDYKKTIIGFFFSVLAGFILIITSCDIKNPTEGLEIRLKNIARTNQIALEIYDGATNLPMTATVTIKFSGNYADQVINSVNEPITSTFSDGGMALFYLMDEVTPTETNPAKLNIILTADGYLQNTAPISLTSTGLSNFEIYMTNVTNTPDGVVSHEQATGNTNPTTGTNDDITVSSGTEPNSNASASITIPKGTQLLDASGNALSGNITTRVTYFNPEDGQSLNSFPGGFIVNTKNQDGSQTEAAFVTAGFVAIDMDVNGTPVEGFGSNVQIDIDVPAGTLNPDTGNPVQPGDVIPLWSLNEDTGEWSWEGAVTVPNLTAGVQVYRIKYKEIRHLSYWNLDWQYTGQGGNYCYNGVTFNFISTTGCWDRVRVDIVKPGTNDLLTQWSGKTVYDYDPQKQLRYAPENTAAEVKVYDWAEYAYNNPPNYVLLGSLSIPNVCDVNAVYDVMFTPNSNERLITANVTAKCTENGTPTVVSLDYYSIYAQKEGGSWYYIGYLENGTISVCLEWMENYYFKALYKSTWYYSKDYNDNMPYKIDKTFIDFTILDNPDICGDL